MKKLPLGIQTFRDIIEGGYVYVDKTQYVYNLINDAKHYFFSRPRRFGKSLLLSTIGEVFGGDRELFRGLWIYDSDYDFIKHPVIRLDLSKMRDLLRGLFASIPYELHVPVEAYYHSIFYAVMNVLGFNVDAEVSVAGGRMDAVLELGDKVYVIEFKYQNCPKDASPEDKEKLFATALAEGLQQIKDRGYANKYAGSGKTVHLAAFAFLGRDEIELATETRVC